MMGINNDHPGQRNRKSSSYPGWTDGQHVLGPSVTTLKKGISIPFYSSLSRVLGTHGVEQMIRFTLPTDHQTTMKVLHDTLKQYKGRLEYYSPSKGVLVFSRPKWKLWALISMVIDVQESPEGSLVILHAFFPGVLLRSRGAQHKFEDHIGKLIKRNAA